MRKMIEIAFAMAAIFACVCGQIWADEAITEQPRFSADAGKIVWKFKTGGQIVSSPSLGIDGNIYFASRDSCMYALNPDGTQKWKVRGEGEFLSSPSVDKKGMVYFCNSPGVEGKGDSYIYRISPDGQLKGKYKIGKYYGSPSFNPDGLLYFQNRGTEIFCAINPENGQIVWTAKILPETYLSGTSFFPTGPNGNVYINGYGSEGINAFCGLWCFSKSGQKQWFFDIPKGILPDNKTLFRNEIFGSPAIDDKGNLYFGVVGNDFYAISDKGQLIWKKSFGLRGNFPYGIGCSPVLSPVNDTLYLANMYGEVIALKMSTGEEIWRLDLKLYAIASPVLSKNRMLYFGVRGGKFFGVDTINGTLKWECMTGSGISSSAVIDQKGILYVGALDSCLYAIDSGGDELAKTPWPMFGRDPQHTARADQIVISDVSEEKKPRKFSLGNAHPNPFNAKTVIPYSVAEKGDVEIIVYNSAGQKAATLFSGKREPGSYYAVWDASGCSSGIYFYSIRPGTGGFLAKKVVLVK